MTRGSNAKKMKACASEFGGGPSQSQKLVAQSVEMVPARRSTSDQMEAEKQKGGNQKADRQEMERRLQRKKEG